MVRAPAGAFTLDAGPTSVILPFWMTIVWLGLGAVPVPSMMVTFVSATTGSATLTYCVRTCCVSFVAAWADSAATGRASWARMVNVLITRINASVAWSSRAKRGIAASRKRPSTDRIAIPRLTAGMTTAP
jgi:hypothetical protein